MSQNPYQSNPTLPQATSVPQQKPGGLTAIAVICLILGSLGALMALFGIAMLFLQGSMNQFQAAQPGGPPPEFFAEMDALQASQFIPTLIVNGCNVLIGSLLAIGSIGVLGTKEWGRSLLRNALLAAIFFVIVRGIYTMWMQYSSMSAMSNMMSSAGENAAAVEMGMQIGIFIGIAFTVIWGAALIVFYIWSWNYLNKPPVRALFGATN